MSKTVYFIEADGTGAPRRSTAPESYTLNDCESMARFIGPNNVHAAHTYAEAREYAQRTTDEACRIADRNRAAAWALPENEPEVSE